MIEGSTKDQIQERAALYMLESGLATVGEVATLRGWSRQRLHKIARELEPRKQRKRFLKEVWKRTLEQLS